MEAHKDGTVKRCSLQVKGLDCAACAEKIEKTLMRHEGVEGVTVYLGPERVDVRYSSGQTDEKGIAKVISDLGYTVVTGGEPVERSLGERVFGKHFEWLRMGLVFALILLSIPQLSALLGIKSDFFAIAAVLIGGYPLVRRAVLDLKERAVTAEVFMTIGVVASTFIGAFRSAAIIALFMLIAEFIDSFTMDRSRRAIRELIEMAPKTARVMKEGREEVIAVEKVKKGDLVVVRPGERIPVEGVITAGRGSVNQAPITGESIPVEKREGDAVYAATVNHLGILFIRVTHTGEDTTYGRIIRLVEEAESSKAPVQRVADRFASYFTPAILSIAFLTFVISGSLTSAIAVLVVACPCTVAIATPLAVVAGMGRAAKKGIIIKGGKYLEALAKVDTLVMDKTGTVTMGDPVVTEVMGFSGHSEEEVIGLAAALERYSEHPLAKAIMKKASEMAVETPETDGCRVVPGMGVEALIEGKTVLLGSREMLRDSDIHLSMEEKGYLHEQEETGRTSLLLSVDGRISGIITVADILREGTVEAIESLRGLGFANPIMLTGDNPRTASAIASSLGIREVMAGLMPEDKVRRIRDLSAAGRRVLMVGDGINDAPALAQAHVGIAMGAVGSDAAIEAADVALMRDEWSQIPEAVRIGRGTFSIIRQNLAVGIVFNIIGISLASSGLLSPAMAAVAHVVPDVLVFLNSSRLMR